MHETTDQIDHPQGAGVHDAAPGRIAENRMSRKPFIVPCPACAGSGRVQRDGSQVQLGCRLCWERGVIALIIAEQYWRATHQASFSKLLGIQS